MVEFILNDRLEQCEEPTGTTLLDYIRYHKSLVGTKIGCREGDCGACMVLVGELRNGRMHYESMTSCLTPVGNVLGKHVVTIEGLNVKGLTPVQQAIVDEGGTQCGFCTVGFAVSLHGYCLSKKPATYENAIAAIDGNICRCTGYKSLERAAARIAKLLVERDEDQPISWLVEQGFLPEYFKGITRWVEHIHEVRMHEQFLPMEDTILVGGGTDLYVQRPEEMTKDFVEHIVQIYGENTITRKDNTIYMGRTTTAEDLQSSPEMQALFPNLRAHIKLVSSTPIRNMGTIAGNFVNASPIGDLTAFFLALDSSILLKKDDKERTIKLKDFYRGYKQIDKARGEVIETIFFEVPPPGSHFNFEKVCKRKYLDIATVNTGISIQVKEGQILGAHVSIGGTGPIPTYLHKTSAFLAGKPISVETMEAANEILQSEITPISDVRGSAAYKRLLARQLFYAHFHTLFPELF